MLSVNCLRQVNNGAFNPSVLTEWMYLNYSLPSSLCLYGVFCYSNQCWLYSEYAFYVSLIFFHLCFCVCSLSHNLVVCAVKMSNYFYSVLFQMFKWFLFSFFFIAILVCRTWCLKKLRLCRRATTLARCNFGLLV